ncbi:MAG TPA: DUF6152 family protein [Gammaproteobacteria bacterium]|nr:DUF6152 family protein [Gammaproteobacteria bacterium]
MAIRLPFAAAVFLAVVLGSDAASAHHSFAAEFDRSKPIDITGKVTKVEWMNPHARFYVETADKDGAKVNWNFELSSPNILIRQGWTRHSLHLGDTVTVKGFRAKLAMNVGSASTVRLKDGRTVFGQPQNSGAGNSGAGQ